MLIFLNNSDLVHFWSNFSSKTKSYKCDFLLDFFIQWRRVIWAAPMLARLIKKFFRKSRSSQTVNNYFLCWGDFVNIPYKPRLCFLSTNAEANDDNRALYKG